MVTSQATTENTPIRFFVEASFTDVPEWIPLLPTPGVYPHPVYGNYDLRPETISRYVANFNDGVYGQKIPLDLEHELRLSGSMADMVEVRTNTDGSVDARLDWNERGRQVVSEGRFSYVSPMLYEKWTDPVSMKQHDNVIIGAALTKRPFFKEGVMRPLIVASEPIVEPSTVEGIIMSEKTPEQLAAEAEGAQITEKRFGEMLAERDDRIKTFAERITAVETENKALKDAAQERTFREQLAGCSDVDDRVKELQALPVEFHEGYLARAKAEVATRKALVGRPELGSDGIKPAGSAISELDAKVAELRKAKPDLSYALAFTEVANANPDLKRKHYAEQAQA